MFCSLPHKNEVGAASRSACLSRRSGGRDTILIQCGRYVQGTSSNCCAQCATSVQHKALRKYRTTLTRLYAIHQAAVSRISKSRCARLRRAIHGQLQTAVSELPPLPQRGAGATSTSYDGAFDVAALYVRSSAAALRSSRLGTNAGVNLLETSRVEQNVQAEFIQMCEEASSSDDLQNEFQQLCEQGPAAGEMAAPTTAKVKRKRKARSPAAPAVPTSLSPELITTALRGCRHWSDVRKVWDVHEQQLNSIHMSASIWKLADLVPPAAQRQMTRQRRRALDVFVLKVVERTHQLAHTADFRTAANIGMGVAKLIPRVRFPQPAPNAAPLSDRAADLVTSLLSSWQQRVGAQEHRHNSNASSNGSSRSAPGAKPADYAQMLWAAAKFNVVPDTEWIQAFCRSSLPQLGVFKREELVITLYSLAVLKLRPDDEWAVTFCDALCTFLPEMSIQEIADITWSLARLQLPVSPSTSQVILHAAAIKAGRLHTDNPKEVASAVMLLIWGLGKLHARAVSESKGSDLSQQGVGTGQAPQEERRGETRRLSESENLSSLLEDAATSYEVNGYSRNGALSMSNGRSSENAISSPSSSLSPTGTGFYSASSSFEDGLLNGNEASSSFPSSSPNGRHGPTTRQSWSNTSSPDSPAMQAAAALFAAASSSTPAVPLPMASSLYAGLPPTYHNSGDATNACPTINSSVIPTRVSMSDSRPTAYSSDSSILEQLPSGQGSATDVPPDTYRSVESAGTAGTASESAPLEAISLQDASARSNVMSSPASGSVDRPPPSAVVTSSSDRDSLPSSDNTLSSPQGSRGDVGAGQVPGSRSAAAPLGLRRPLLPGFGAHPRPALSWQVARMGSRPNSNNIFSPDSSWDEGYECIFPSARPSQWKPDRSWVASVCRWSIPLLSHCQPRELAAALHGFANLAIIPDALWLDQFFSITPLHFKTLSVKEIATICWALGRLQERPPVTWMRRFLCEMAVRQRHDFSRAEMVQIVWCMQQLRVASVHLFSPEAIMRLKTNRHVFHAFLQRIAAGRPRGRLGGVGGDRRSQQPGPR